MAAKEEQKGTILGTEDMAHVVSIRPQFNPKHSLTHCMTLEHCQVWILLLFLKLIIGLKRSYNI